MVKNFKTFRRTLKSLIAFSAFFLFSVNSSRGEWVTLEQVNPENQLIKGNWVSLEPVLPSSANKKESVPLPDFSSFKNVKEKKEQFFQFMLPKIRLANTKIRVERSSLQDVFDRNKDKLILSDVDKKFLGALKVMKKVTAFLESYFWRGSKS